MNCPVCNIELKPADRQGIELDYCPQCRGIWVAREVLDRILRSLQHQLGQREEDEVPYTHEGLLPTLKPVE
jgi:Zn-finger nucleic acid-binding protein